MLQSCILCRVRERYSEVEVKDCSNPQAEGDGDGDSDDDGGEDDCSGLEPGKKTGMDSKDRSEHVLFVPDVA